MQPIIIYPNVEICQVYYHDIHGEYEEYKSGKYQGNTGAQPSLFYKDFLRLVKSFSIKRVETERSPVYFIKIKIKNFALRKIVLKL